MSSNEKTPKVRDPERTHSAIIDAAKNLIAKEGTDAVSVSKVARLAGVNRGTAYLHFKDRDDLLKETIDSVRRELIEAIRTASADIANWAPGDDTTMERISKTLGENAVLARIWLAELILSDQVEKDPLLGVWREGLTKMREAEHVASDIDQEVLAVIGLSATFLWPIMVHSERMSKSQRSRSAKRFAKAFDRIVLSGILNK